MSRPSAVEKMIAKIHLPLLIVYDPADNIQVKDRHHSAGNHRGPDQKNCAQLL
jgi:hypothetical protein